MLHKLETTSTAAAWSGVVGGNLWAVTPLRDLVLGAGSDPRDGVAAFRAYNLYVVVAVLLMAAALLALRRGHTGAPPTSSRLIAVGTVLTGHAMLAAGSLLAVLLGGRSRELVMAGQDLGFLAAVLAAAGACALGVSGLRRGSLPRAAALLFAVALPLGVLGAVLLVVAGAPDDLLGLPLTALYGGAFVALGIDQLTSGRAEAGIRSPSRRVPRKDSR